MRKPLLSVLLPAAAGIAFLALWQAAHVALGEDLRFLLPAPGAVRPRPHRGPSAVPPPSGVGATYLPTCQPAYLPHNLPPCKPPSPPACYKIHLGIAATTAGAARCDRPPARLQTSLPTCLPFNIPD